MQENDNSTKKKTFQYFLFIFLGFSIASLFDLITEPGSKLGALKSISTMAAAFIGMVLSYNFKQETVLIRFAKYFLGITAMLIVCHYVKYLSILTLVFVYTGAYWAFSTDKIKVNLPETKSLINEIEERKRLDKLKNGGQNI